MWINPKFADRVEAPARTPPVETGRRLATFPRQAKGGPRQQLRIYLAEYEGNPYLSVGLWQESDDGSGWWPLKSISVRRHEAEGVAEAIGRAFADDR